MVKCSNAGCSKSGGLLCGKCGEAKYCSRECQVGHWAVHSTLCYQKTADDKIQTDSLSIKQLKYIIMAKINSLPSSSREALREKEGGIVEKAPLISLVEASMTQAEMKEFLTAYAQEKAAPAQSSSAKKKQKSNTDTQLEQLKQATPEQLRQQAKMFRSDPERVRRGNPQLANMSEADLLASADQMEMMANNPEMLKEAIRQMESMSPEEREMASKVTPEQREAINNMTPQQKAQMQKMQSLSAEQRRNIMKFQTGLNGTIDDEFTRAVLGLLANKGEAFKLMSKSMFELPDEQVDPWVEMFAGMDEWTIRLVCRFLGFLQSIGRPLMKGYEILDKYTFGLARHIVMLVIGICMYYSFLTAWSVAKYMYGLVFATVTTASSSVASGPATASTQKTLDPILDKAAQWAADNAAGGEFDF
jgi:hypothetical protein